MPHQKCSEHGILGHGAALIFTVAGIYNRPA
jgi:hypothetical protein